MAKLSLSKTGSRSLTELSSWEKRSGIPLSKFLVLTAILTKPIKLVYITETRNCLASGLRALRNARRSSLLVKERSKWKV